MFFRNTPRRCPVQDKLVEHPPYIPPPGQELAEVRNWTWNEGSGKAGVFP